MAATLKYNFTIFIFSIIFKVISGFPLEIDQIKCKVTTIYVVRTNEVSRSWETGLPGAFLYHEKIHINIALNEILEDTTEAFRTSYPTWFISNSSDVISSYNDYKRNGDPSGIASPTKSYVPAKSRNSEGLHACTIMITSIVEMFAIAKDTPEYLNHKVWAPWLKQVGQGRFIPLQTGGFSNKVVLAFNVQHGLNKYNRNHNAAFSAHVLTFLIYLKYEQHVPSVGKIYWLCNYCEIERQIFLGTNPFSPNFTNQVLLSYTRWEVPAEFVGPSKVLIPPTPSRPTITAIISWKEEFQSKKRFYCRSPMQIVRYHGQRDEFTEQCLDPITSVIKTIGDHLNYTTIFGDYTLPEWLKIVPRAHFECNQILGLEHVVETEISGYAMVDTSSTILTYCDTNQNLTVVDIMHVIGSPFQANVWLAIGLLIGVCLAYSWLGERHKQKSLSDMLLETVRVWLHNECQDNMTIGRMVVVSAALFGFYYKTDMSANMIAPPAPYIKGTLKELLEGDFKIWRFVAPAGTKNETILALRMAQGGVFNISLKGEGYKKNLVSEDAAWAPVLWETDFITGADALGKAIVNRKELEKAEENARRHKCINHFSAFSLKRYHPTPTYFKNDTLCHRVPKRYGNTMAQCSIYSVARVKLTSMLHRLLYDSGIRMLWTDIEDSYTQRSEVIPVFQGVQVMSVDERMVAILIVWACLLGMAFVLLILEDVISGMKVGILFRLNGLIKYICHAF